ncbi:MAG TPA: hypothetical protein VFU59_02800, partial [Candidatus Eisenbacteria bacterium]|nr:hypothetical protein [Candidatus Eisenbacteria bacterium]
SDTLGMAPSGAVVMAGEWVVLEDSAAAAQADAASLPSGGDSAAAPAARNVSRLLRQTSGEEARAANWIRLLKPTVENGEVSVRFRIRSGEIDPSVGVLFQVDPKGRNGYLVRVSGADNELIAHYLLSGKRRDLKMQKIDAAPAAGEWHTLGIRRERERLYVLYDGAEKMMLRDERFIRGTVGLWTEDDTVADFADLKITAR